MDQLANFVAYSPQVQAIPDGQTSLQPNPGERQHSAKRLNPYFVGWLMGWPMGWVSTTVRPVSGPAEMVLWHFKLQSQLAYYLPELKELFNESEESKRMTGSPKESK